MCFLCKFCIKKLFVSMQNHWSWNKGHIDHFKPHIWKKYFVHWKCDLQKNDGQMYKKTLKN